MSTFELLDTAQSQLISTAELARIISYKSQTIRKWLCQDKLPEGLPRPKQINGRHYWLRNEIADYIATFSVRSRL
ncbi:DNA-binding protein [Salmonella enterica]|uniref:DNA-binding protein n=4 Tax=Salmonella enterica TaxID=28901 RepID=A0A3Y9C3Q3_SALEB|nr:DNA-binding protein [Salmonella enterica subsp. enterica serovar Java]EAN9726987.1 DNA-binding protein [Salmonella enterica]EBV8393915.1 DNA-binding protein [Salmonella enterica subsp. enterica serovar Virchow]ECA3793130.1 DNA-binding protein [Salmonella enterica subsp. enterica serovar Aqua]EDV9614199.1 DNA-binding protein [Salmonella enterica subsp. enterica serovar Paratyphi B]EHE8611186.1 DNA-binding protein [Salmonella enterica subsp. enterica serovar 4,[5],12:b:-]